MLPPRLFVAILLAAQLPGIAQAFLGAPKLSPISQMHALPRIEEPGWLAPKEFKFDLNQANHWNAPANFLRSDTGQTLRAEIDFEQTTWMMTLGAEATEWLQLGAEISWIDRSGGHFDRMIDQFHVDTRIYRFQRERYQPFRSKLLLQTDGNVTTGALTPSGLSNLVLRAKFWLARWGDAKFATGASVLARLKHAVDDGSKQLSSGSQDQSLSVLIGTPVGSSSALYFAASQVQMGGNRSFKDWPTRNTAQSFETSFVWGFSDAFQIILNHGIESPYMDSSRLEFIPETGRENEASKDRSSSAFNHFTDWRGQQTFGVRFQMDGNSTLALYMTEDWELANLDGLGELFNTTGAPDVSIGLQYSQAL